jgi:hypothetical protein
MKSLTKDAHINQQVLILAFCDQWQSQVSAFGRGLNRAAEARKASRSALPCV